MSTDADTDSHPRSVLHRVRARPGLQSLLRSLFVAAAVVVGYFVLPFTSPLDADTVLVLVIGVGLVVGLLVWQIRAITTSHFPVARAIGALAITLPLFIVVFATTYYLMGSAEASSWSESLNRLDSMYFTVTVFATVGFGDITATSGTARAVVTVQMVGDLVLVGLVTRVIFTAVQDSLKRLGRRPE
ncbi:MAG: potassium channel family protein [Nocardioidaceae bacterium]